MEFLKTGVIYDPQMLDHKARRKHPQTPQRIKVIIQGLQQHDILSHPRIQYLPFINRVVQQNELMLAHPQKYINFCLNLWPKSGHRADITVLDTYFNEKSQRIGRIAAGGLLQGIDKLMEGKWQNGFAIIRPPGHHSGAKNTINGFCIYNNVAIGANYILQKWKKQKVAIVDWDVHHGDGTQHIMQKNNNVLFISIHRHDRGTFYPAGDQGHFHNDGFEQAKGSKINIPLDFVDEKFNPYNFQTPGDNEYIYIYHRIVQPILKQFNPDVILISSGFDAANGDPLGGFTVTPHGYYYMTKRILQLKKPVLVALQGGYNLQAIKNSAVNIVKALLDQQPHEPFHNYRKQLLLQPQLKHLCSIHPIIHEQIDLIISHHQKSWPCLSHEQHLVYTQKIKKNQQKCFGIIQDQSSSDQSSQDDQTKYIDEFHNDTRVELVERKCKEKREKVKKKINRIRKLNRKRKLKNKIFNNKLNNKKKIHYNFILLLGIYRDLKMQVQIVKPFQNGHINLKQNSFNHLFNKKVRSQILWKTKLIHYPIKFTLSTQISHNNGYKIIKAIKKSIYFIIETIKIKKKQLSSTGDKLGFRISGYTTPDFKQGGIMTYTQQQVKTKLKIIVNSQNKQQFSDYLTQMIDCLSKVKRKYWGTSIVLITSSIKSTIRWIDFHYYTQQTQTYDEDLVEGLQNLRDFFNLIQ